jgi:hypothetical protein
MFFRFKSPKTDLWMMIYMKVIYFSVLPGKTVRGEGKWYILREETKQELDSKPSSMRVT